MMKIVVACIESGVIQVDRNHFSVDGLGVDDEINHNKGLFLGESLLELNLHSILPVVNHDLLRGRSFGEVCLNCRINWFVPLIKLCIALRF